MWSNTRRADVMNPNPKWNRPFLIHQYSTVSLGAMMKVQMPFRLLYLYQTGSLADVI